MPYNRPQLSQIYQQIYNDLGPSRFRVSFNRALAKALAGTAHMLHGHIAYLSKNLLPDSAERVYLERWASIWKVHRKPAEKARGKIILESTGQVRVSAGTLFKAPQGTTYALRSEAIVEGQLEVEIEAVEPGELSNIPSTDPAGNVTVEMTIPGLKSTALISKAVSGGTDQEKDDSLRERLLDRIQHPPQGGALHDYVLWAKEISGVTRAWVLPRPGEGIVRTTFVMDRRENIVPEQTDIERLNSKLAQVAPAGAACTSVAPIPVPKKIKIYLVPATENDAIKARIISSLKDLYIREAAPKNFFDIDRKKMDGAIPVSRISQAISSVEGEKFHKLYNEYDSPLTENLSVSNTGELLIFTEPTFIRQEPSSENP